MPGRARPLWKYSDRALVRDYWVFQILACAPLVALVIAWWVRNDVWMVGLDFFVIICTLAQAYNWRAFRRELRRRAAA